MRTHTGERPFEFEEEGCDYAAADISNLKWHTPSWLPPPLPPPRPLSPPATTLAGAFSVPESPFDRRLLTTRRQRKQHPRQQTIF